MAKRTQVVFDAWDSYVSEADAKPMFISFDVEAAQQDLTDTLTHCARVLIPVKRPNRNGGPVPPESDVLYGMEDELCGSLAKHGVDCRLVGRITCDGMRELVYQVDDWETFRPIVGIWILDHEDYEIDVSEHEGWGFFNDCIRPTPDTWLFLADRSVIHGLRDAGSNLDKEHDLEFVFIGGERGLRQAARSLVDRGYTPLGTPDYASGEMVMVKRMLLDEDAVFAETQTNRELAAEHGINYDGWGAAVVR